MTENDRKEIKTRQANLEKLKKKLNELKLSRKRSKKYRLDLKQKLDVLDQIIEVIEGNREGNSRAWPSPKS